MPELMKLDPATPEFKKALNAAWHRLHDFPEPSNGERDREAEIVMEVIKAFGEKNQSVDLRLTWASWLYLEILGGNGDAFKRMTKYVEGLRAKGPDGKPACQLPRNVTLPRNLLPKGRKGAPPAARREDSNLRLFAKAAIPHIVSAQIGLHFLEAKLLPAKQIEDDFNKLRQQAHPGSPPVSDSEFSRCVKEWDLGPLLQYDRSRPGPKKGSRQTVRNQSRVRLRKTPRKTGIISN